MVIGCAEDDLPYDPILIITRKIGSGGLQLAPNLIRDTVLGVEVENSRLTWLTALFCVVIIVTFVIPM